MWLNRHAQSVREQGLRGVQPTANKNHTPVQFLNACDLCLTTKTTIHNKMVSRRAMRIECRYREQWKPGASWWILKFLKARGTWWKSNGVRWVLCAERVFSSNWLGVEFWWIILVGTRLINDPPEFWFGFGFFLAERKLYQDLGWDH